jgi:acetylornithine/N-succinyldiaminopimelate aminotransferase
LSDLAATRGLPGERGRGLLRALNLGRPVAAQVAAAALALQPEGLLVNAPRPHLLRFMPALNVSFDEIDLMVDMLAEVLEQAG